MFSYTYDNINEIIYTEIPSYFSSKDAIAYMMKVNKELNKILTAGQKVHERLYLTNLQDTELNYHDIIELEAAFKKYGHANNISDTTFIVNSDFSYGMARMLKTAVEDLGHKITIRRMDVNEPHTFKGSHNTQQTESSYQI